jgi:hypothetical protein
MEPKIILPLTMSLTNIISGTISAVFGVDWFTVVNDTVINEKEKALEKKEALEKEKENERVEEVIKQNIDSMMRRLVKKIENAYDISIEVNFDGFSKNTNTVKNILSDLY